MVRGCGLSSRTYAVALVTVILLGLGASEAYARGGPTRRSGAKAGQRDAGRRRPPARGCRGGKGQGCPRPRHHVPPAPPRPFAATGAATSVTGSGAVLTATLKPGRRAVTYWFQYGTGTSYGARTPMATATATGAGVAVSATLSGLTPLAVYHYRIVASTCGGCAAGTARGSDAAFTVGGYANPVFGSDAAPDPYVLDDGGRHRDYWAFTTGALFPTLFSNDLVHWSSVGTALSSAPTWVIQSGDWHPWAPSVTEVPASCPGSSSGSCYVMYYVGLSAQYGVNCVAVATASSPGGPYADQGPLSAGPLDASGRPIGCGDNSGYGVIDPSVFVDPADGQPYLYVSEEHACAVASLSCTGADSTLAPTISAIPLSHDYLHAAGPRAPLLAGDPGGWEASGVTAPTVEAPTVIAHDGTYYLLYSGGSWRAAYGMGYATASSAVGPFTKSSANPILAQSATVFSPGGADTPVTGPHGGMWLVYHGRLSSYATPRTLMIGPFGWQAVPPGPDVPVISAPTSAPESDVP